MTVEIIIQSNLATVTVSMYTSFLDLQDNYIQCMHMNTYLSVTDQCDDSLHTLFILTLCSI